MESNIQIFENAEFGEIRTVTIDNQPWFLGKDVANALGYTKSSNAIIAHVDEDDRKELIYKACPESGQASLWQGNDFSNKTLVNESGLYALIFGSKLESAQRFKHWVTAEVLPAIRRTGGYIPVKDTDYELSSGE